MKKSQILIIVLVVAIAIGFGYASLGGLEKLNFTLENNASFTIHGEEYKGFYNSKGVEQIFNKSREAAKRQNTTLAIINYGDDEDAKNIQQFIGILSSDSAKVQTLGFSKRNLSASVFIKAVLDIHNSVMPKPEYVREQVTEFADSLGYTVEPFTLELYSGDQSLTIIFPVK